MPENKGILYISITIFVLTDAYLIMVLNLNHSTIFKIPNCNHPFHLILILIKQIHLKVMLFSINCPFA